MNKRIIIIGANGVMGQVATSILANREDFVIFPTSRFSSDQLAIDLLNPQSIDEAVRKISPDYILNFGATFSGDFSQAYKTNVEGSKFLLDAVAQYVPECKIILVGSAAEYGVVFPEDNPVKETHKLQPVSIYGLTKAWQTELMYYYANMGLNVKVARIFNLNGAEMSDRLFIGRVQTQIKEVLDGKRQFIELGPLTAVRDYINVYDAFQLIFQILCFGNPGNVYNVGSGKPITMRQVLESELNKYNLSMDIVKEAISYSNRVGYDVPVIYADTTKSNSLLSKIS